MEAATAAAAKSVPRVISVTGACHALRHGPPAPQFLPLGTETPEVYRTNFDFPVSPNGEVYRGPLVMQCLKHYVPMDVEYRRIRSHLSEFVTVSEGTSAFTHVDVGDFNEDNRRGRAYPPA
eukprot:5403985-Amphidinium_carterae.1